jgi:hypothetical protein
MAHWRTVGWAAAALVGPLGFVGAVAGLHLAQPELRPLTEAVSYYVHGAHGGWLTAGLLSLGLGSLALAPALRATSSAPLLTVARWGVSVWGLCVVAGGLFPADPAGRWSEPPSFPGLVHGGAALLGFLALPVAAIAFGRGVRADPRWHTAARLLGFLGILCPIALVVFMASLWPTLGADRPPILLGLSERLLLAVYVAWLLASAYGAARVALRA